MYTEHDVLASIVNEGVAMAFLSGGVLTLELLDGSVVDFGTDEDGVLRLAFQPAASN